MAANQKRIYAVNDGNAVRLVKAMNQADARNHVLKDTLVVTIPTADEFLSYGKSGVAVEEAAVARVKAE